MVLTSLFWRLPLGQWDTRPLKRMTLGMLIIAVSFVVAALVELAQMRSQVSVGWMVCRSRYLGATVVLADS